MRHACGNKGDIQRPKIERFAIDIENGVSLNQQHALFTVMKVKRDFGAAGKFSVAGDEGAGAHARRHQRRGARAAAALVWLNIGRMEQPGTGCGMRHAFSPRRVSLSQSRSGCSFSGSTRP